MQASDGLVHSYLLLLHNDLPQADRLIQLLLSEKTSRVAVHLDKRMDRDEHLSYLRRWADLGADIVQNRRFCRWGGIGLVDATLELIRLANHRHRFHHASLLSGSDWPCIPLGDIDRALRAQPMDYIEVDPLPKENWQGGGWDRIRVRHLADAKRGLKHKADRALTQVQKAVRLEVPDGQVARAFGNSPVWAGGSQWWTLRRDTIQTLLENATVNTALRNRLRHAWVPDEIYFQTLLRNVVGDAAVTGRLTDASLTRRYMDFSRTTKPAVLRSPEQIIAALDSGAFFMRKIDSASLTALRKVGAHQRLPQPLGSS